MNPPPEPRPRLWLERLGTLLLAMALWYVIRQRTDAPKRPVRSAAPVVLFKQSAL